MRLQRLLCAAGLGLGLVGVARADVGLSLVPDTSTYVAGATVTVKVHMDASATPVFGGQFFLKYDTTKLAFVDAQNGSAPFHCNTGMPDFDSSCPRFLDFSSSAGVVNVSVGTHLVTGPGATAATDMVILHFTATGATGSPTAGLVYFDPSHVPLSMLGDGDAHEVPTTQSDLPAISTTVFSGTSIYVDDGYVGLANGTPVNWPADGNPGPHAIGVDAFATVQGGVNAASTGATVHVAAGTYTENVSVSKQITIQGAGSGTNPSSDSIVNPAAGSTPIFSISSGGTDGSNRLRIESFRVTGATGSGNSGSGILFTGGNPSFVTLDNVTSTGNGGSGFAIDATGSIQDIEVLNSSLSNNGLDGMRIPTSLVGLNGLTITNTQFSGNANIGLEVYASVGHTGLTNVAISGSQFTNNVFKGAYFERLDNANLSNISVTGNGTGASSPAGIDVNLKYATYSNIAMNTATFSNNGNGAASGNGLTIKARNDAPSYSGTPATLNGLTLSNVSLTGAPVNLAIGNNVTLASVSMSGVTISGTGRGFVVFQNTAGQTLNAGDTSFAGTLSDAIEEGSPGTTVDATGATFNGLAAGSLTLAQAFGTVDTIIDDVDIGTSLAGFVRIQANKVFLTPNSFQAPTTTSALVQRAIDAATAGNTIFVQAATYSGNPNVNKSVTLSGPNAGIAGGGARGAEATLITSGNQTAVVSIGANNVTIDGLFLEGDDPSVTGASLTGSGDDSNVSYGVRPTSNYSGITVRNSIVKHAAMAFRGDGASSGNSISSNWFDDIGFFDFGYAVSLRSEYYADVTNNKMTRVWSALHTNNFHLGGAPASWSFSGNEVHSYAGGVLNWLEYGSARSLTINNNTFAAEASAVANNSAIEFVTIQDGVTPIVTNNSISGYDYGVIVTNATNTTPITLGATNSISGAKKAAVLLTNNVGFNAVNTTVLNSPGYPGTSTLNIVGLQVTGAQTDGIIVDAQPGAPSPQPSRANINSNTHVAGTSATGSGVKVNGTLALASIVNNPMSFGGFTNGILVDGGAALIQGNTITGNSFAGIKVQNNGKADAGDCTSSNFTGLGSSSGGNVLTGYGFNDTFPWAVYDGNTSAQFNVRAQNNDYGATVSDSIAMVVFDGADSAGANSLVLYSQSGGQAISASATPNDYCNFVPGVPATVTLSATYAGPGTIHWFDGGNCMTPGTPIVATGPSIVIPAPTAPGVYTYVAQVNDGCVTECSTTTVTVHAAPVVTINADLANETHAADRCFTFKLFDAASCGSHTAAFTQQQTLNFTGGHATASFTVPCDVGGYTSVSGTDPLHTLRRTTDATHLVYDSMTGNYTVNFTDTKAFISGNLNNDSFIDILDFGGFVTRFGTHPPANTDCASMVGPIHPDFNGDGVVDSIDFTYISTNFFAPRDADCTGSLVDVPTTSVGVIDLGRTDWLMAQKADLNRDGVLDSNDINFMGQHGLATCPADYYGDGVVNVQDIFVYLSNWFAGYPGADFNDDHRVAVDDIFAFLNAWFTGCN